MAQVNLLPQTPGSRWAFNLMLLALGVGLIFFARSALLERKMERIGNTQEFPSDASQPEQKINQDLLQMENPPMWRGLLILALIGITITSGCALLSWWGARKVQRLDAFFRPAVLLPAPYGLPEITGVIGLYLFGASLATIILVLRGLPLPAGNDALLYNLGQHALAESLAFFYGLMVILKRGLPGGELEDKIRRTTLEAFKGMGSWLAFTPVFLALLLLSYLLNYLLDNIPAEPNQILQIVEAAKTNPFTLILLIFFVTIAAPVIEEVIFRGILYDSLRKHLPLFWAALLCGIIFGAAHGEWLKVLPVGALGMMLCYLREKSGGLAAPIAAHAVNNTAATILFILGQP